MKIPRTLAFLLLVIFLFSTRTQAASPWTEEVTYGDKVAGKVVYGMANFWGGWISLGYEPALARQEKKNIALGAARGLAYGVINTVGGLAHLVTAPITALDIPLPRNGVEIS